MKIWKNAFFVLHFEKHIEKITIQHSMPPFLPECYHSYTKIPKSIKRAPPRDKNLSHNNIFITSILYFSSILECFLEVYSTFGTILDLRMQLPIGASHCAMQPPPPTPTTGQKLTIKVTWLSFVSSGGLKPDQQVSS